MTTKNTKDQFTPGWPGMKYDVIPAHSDCDTCRNTGYVISHGRPRDSRTGAPRFDYPCECGRDPIKFLHEQCLRLHLLSKSTAAQNQNPE